jgi:hypothetical protein
MELDNFGKVISVFFVISLISLIISGICLKTENYEVCGKIYGSSNNVTSWLVFCVSIITIIFICIGVILKYTKIPIPFLYIRRRRRNNEPFVILEGNNNLNTITTIPRGITMYRNDYTNY